MAPPPRPGSRRRRGFDVVSSGSAGLVDDPERIEPGAVVDRVSRHLGDDAEAVLIGGTGFRAARAIEALEERCRRPVLESNQVLLWSVLASVGADVQIHGFGRLFRLGWPDRGDELPGPARSVPAAIDHSREGRR